MALLALIPIIIIPILSILISLLFFLAAYDSFKRYKCYIILTDTYISVNCGILNGFKTIELCDIDHFEFKRNVLTLFVGKYKKNNIYINVLDKYNKDLLHDFIISKVN